MSHCRIGLIVLAIGLGCLVQAQAADLSGDWTYQALNSSDTNFRVEQKAGEINLYRILYPEFEGKHYKLEHWYKGALKAQVINGKMFVREEGMTDFEFLRPFVGKMTSEEKMVVDDLPLRRSPKESPSSEVGDALASAPEGERAGSPTAEPTPPAKEVRYNKITIKREVAAATKKTPDDNRSAPLPKDLKLGSSELVLVGRTVTTPEGAEVEALLKDGDVLFEKKKDYGGALGKFEEALAKQNNKVELLYKIGHCHGILGSSALKAKDPIAARRHFTQAIAYWGRALRFDPYNNGAKENIRRSKEKLTQLQEH